MSDQHDKPEKEAGEKSGETSRNKRINASDVPAGVEPEYLAKLSHRMRNAMNIIVGYSEIVAEMLAAEESGLEREMNKIVDSAHEMVELVGDVEKALETARARHEQFDELADRAHRDPLTGYLNRRRFFELARAALAGAQAADEPVAMLMIDIDDFKNFNDRFGHQLGDEVLKLVSRSCDEVLRDTDLFGRYGGEEFIVLARHVDSAKTAHLIAERLRRAVDSLGIARQDQLLSVTVSVGVAISEPDIDLDEFVRRADSALYAAKSGGRNRVVPWSDVDE